MAMFKLYFQFAMLICYSIFPSHCQGVAVGSQSTSVLSNFGLEFSPLDAEALLLLETSTTSTTRCAQKCHSTVQCRIFDFDKQSKRCRLFAGDVNMMGSLVPSSFSQSRVGTIKLDPKYFADRGRPCSFCQGSRYLKCVNSTCQCSGHTFFNGLVCESQKLLGAKCFNETECRLDLNFTCLPRMQCGPISLQSGTLLGGYGNGTAGSALNALQFPWGLVVDDNGSLFVSDYNNQRVIKLEAGSLVGTIVAGTGVAGHDLTQLHGPAELHVDTSKNIYVCDSYNHRVMLRRTSTSTGIVVAGNGTAGNTLSTMDLVIGLAVDSQGNIYVSDWNNNRVMKWAPNATNGTIVAGTGGVGNGNNQLNRPYGLYLDELRSHLYIAEINNHRIQRYSLGNTINGTTVAGGNGAGGGNHQLNAPYAVCVSKTGDIYVADSGNQRIQRWSPGATQGVTVVGVTGVIGSTLTLLNQPIGITLNSNETYLYVSDGDNHRILRFKLI